MNTVTVHGQGGPFECRMYRGTGALTVATARGELRAQSGDLIITSPTGEVTVVTPQTAHLIFGDDVMAIYREAPEFLGLSPAQIADLSSPTHGAHVPADIEVARAAQGKGPKVPEEVRDEPQTGAAGSGGDSGAGNTGSTPATPEETPEARRIRETMERVKAQQK